MVTVDFRTRLQGSATAIEVGEFRDERLPALLHEHGALAARGVATLGLGPLAFTVDDVSFTLVRVGDTLEQRPGVHEDATAVVLDREGFSNLVNDVISTLGLGMAGKVEMAQGRLDGFVAWEPVLRALFDGRPVHEPGMVELLDDRGHPLDLHQSFTLADDPERIATFLAAAGFLTLRGVFAPDEMAAIVTELDAATAEAERDDGQSWWARDGSGEWYAARVLGFNEKSPALRGDARRAVRASRSAHRRRVHPSRSRHHRRG